ncbi:MAG: hypothetical protein R2707_13510 [Acidimicrobiales bacterium]
MTTRHSPWILGLLAPLVCAEIALRILASSLPSPDPWPSVGLEVKSEYAERLVGDEIDVLFLGSSVTEAGIDPDQLLAEFGVSAFNAAGPYSTPIGMQRWLDHSLWPLEPDTIVIGLSIWGAPDDEDDDVLATGFDALVAHEGQRGSILGRSEFWWRRSQLRDLVGLLSESVDATSYTERGHLTIYRNQQRRTAEDLSDGAPFPGFSADNETALAEIVNEAQRRGSRVVLLLEPGGCPAVLPGCANPDSERRALEAVAEMADSLGVALINGRELAAPDEWFADSAHFNGRGTAGFTEFIGAALQETATP